MARQIPNGTRATPPTERRELFDGQGCIVFEGHRIGGGGMGAVYAGRCAGGEGEVVLKEYRVEDYDERTLAVAMDSECRILRNLALKGYRAPKLLAQGDYRRGRKGLWFLMTRASGTQLDIWLKTHMHAPLGKKLAVLKGIAEAIAKLHQLGIVHLDLKPANIFVDDRGPGAPAVELIDFGNARDLSLTTEEARDEPMLTPGYASPEHFDGLARCRESADHFVLGVLCAEVLTGALPFARAGGQAALIEGDRQAVKARLRAHGVGEELADFIAWRLLAIESGRRGPGTAAELAALLSKGSGGWFGKWWVWAILAGACGLGIALSLQNQPEETEPDPWPPEGQTMSSATNSAPAAKVQPRSAFYTNNSVWTVVFSDGTDTMNVPPGGTIGTNWTPVGTRPGSQIGELIGLGGVQAPMVEVRFPDKDIRFTSPQSVQLLPTIRDKDRSTVRFQLTDFWKDISDEVIQATITNCFKPIRTDAPMLFEWNNVRTGKWFVAGGTNVLTCSLAPRLASPAVIHTNNSEWTVAFSDGTSTSNVPPGGTIGTNWIPVGAELGSTFGNAGARTRGVDLRTVQPPTVELVFGGDLEFAPRISQMHWETNESGSVQAQLSASMRRYSALQLKTVFTNSVTLKRGLNPEDYEISIQWSGDEFVEGMTNTLTVTATRKPDVVNELKNENRFTILVDGEELNAGDVIQLASRPPKSLAVKDDQVNQWACTIVSPDNVSTVRGTTNTYTVAVQENPKPNIVVTNSGPVPVFFDWNGRKRTVSANGGLSFESDGKSNEFVFHPETNDSTFTDWWAAYEWATMRTNTAPKYGETQTLDSMVARTNKEDVKLVLHAPKGVAVDLALSGTYKWLDEDGKNWHSAPWTSRAIQLGAGTTFSTNIPWLNVWDGGVNVEWKANGYKTPPSTNIVFREAGDEQSIALALQLESKSVAVTNTSPIPVVVWLTGHGEQKTILPNKDASFSWTPTSASAKAPQICYQPAPTLDTNSWGIWGFKMEEVKTNTVIRLQPDSEVVRTFLQKLQEQVNSCPEIVDQSKRWMWSTTRINELKALRGCGLTTNDVSGVRWPSFNELKEKLQSYLNIENSERIQNARNLVKDAADWDDFMKSPTSK